ncbi:MAG TPA: glycosyltransferase family 39 protein [Acidobacteriaceae bacterium]|nr:glycosyltransferase family 39 protein [Acidobacteriaceae bacterium]
MSIETAAQTVTLIAPVTKGKAVREFRIEAVLCALGVVVCELISKPFTTMSICDDGPYIRMAHTFANTGHIVYNGWGAALMAAQLCIAAVFIKLFGFSATCVRMSTLLLAAVTAFVFHRTLVRTGGSGRNATLATLAVVLSPLYLMLSVTFMTDIAGLFATTLCLYGCVRAIEASSDRSAIGWVCFAVLTCAVFGTSRQIAWLGDIVMVPCALWLLRARRRVLLPGLAATAISFLFILGCMHWLARQPYAVPVPLIVRPFPLRVALLQLSLILLEIPFLVFPVIALFVPGIFKTKRYVGYLLLAVLVAYVAIAFHWRKELEPLIRLEPTAASAGSFVNVSGVFSGLAGIPDFLHTKPRVILTALCIAGLLGVIAVAFQAGTAKSAPLTAGSGPTWKQLGVLLLPFSVAYLVLLGATVGTTYNIYDRYALNLLGPAMIVLVRLYQERMQPHLSLASVPLVAITCVYGIFVTHNTFALDRARVDLANEIHASGVPFTAIDGSWDYNFDTELDIATHLNNRLLKVPANGYIPPPPQPADDCLATWYAYTPHIHALYGVSLFRDICYGEAPFAPVQYRPWPLRKPINLYAVRYLPPGR